jgi:hypothetical protein
MDLWIPFPSKSPSLSLRLTRPCFHRWALLTRGNISLAEQSRCCIRKAGRRRRQARLVLNSEPPIPPPRCLYGRCDGAASASFRLTPTTRGKTREAFVDLGSAQGKGLSTQNFPFPTGDANHALKRPQPSPVERRPPPCMLLAERAAPRHGSTSPRRRLPAWTRLAGCAPPWVRRRG